MLTTRVVARLDVKPPNVVKGRRFDGLRVMGSLYECAQRAQAQGADELLYVDIVASLYGRPPNGECIEAVSRDLYIPLTVCGGIRSLEDVRTAMRLGADKVGINTGLVEHRTLGIEIAKKYGSQAVVLSVEAKQRARWWESWEPLTHGGREPTGFNLASWVGLAVKELSVGEILLTSVDHDGMGTGCDLNLIRAVRAAAPTVPLIASGGIGTPHHAWEALQAGADAVACASLLYTDGLGAVKAYLSEKGVCVRADT
jgi:cyclase